MQNLISAKLIEVSKLTDTAKLFVDNSVNYTFELVFPRIILPEFNTHRVFSRNSASSRAIPFWKMLKKVKEQPFVPIAFQKQHRGMQGTEYNDPDEKVSSKQFRKEYAELFKKADLFPDSTTYFELSIKEKVLNYSNTVSESGFKHQFDEYDNIVATRHEWFLALRDVVCEMAVFLHSFGVTKQIANRILEPFSYHKVILTTDKLNNFFNQRCPRYGYGSEEGLYETYSKVEYIQEIGGLKPFEDNLYNDDFYKWAKINSSHAEIHIQDLAEKMRVELLKLEEYDNLPFKKWHLPYIKNDELNTFDSMVDAIKVSVARCARVSYQTFDDSPNHKHEKDFELFNKLAENGHSSPFEHISYTLPNGEKYTLRQALETSRGGNLSFPNSHTRETILERFAQNMKNLM